MCDTAWIDYQKEQWRKRTQVRRERNRNIKKHCLAIGISRLSEDDLFKLRRTMYDEPGSWYSSFYADQTGNLVWLEEPFKALPSADRCPNERLRQIRRRNDERTWQNLLNNRPWNDGLEWP